MITIWPQYLDKNLTLSEGRKISKEYAVSSPTMDEIEKALKRLGLYSFALAFATSSIIFSISTVSKSISVVICVNNFITLL